MILPIHQAYEINRPCPFNYRTPWLPYMVIGYYIKYFWNYMRTAAVAQWVRALVPQAEGRCSNPSQDRRKSSKQLVKAPLINVSVTGPRIDWLIDWLDTPYRQYFGHVTAATISSMWSVLNFWSFPGGSHDPSLHWKFSETIISVPRRLWSLTRGTI